LIQRRSADGGIATTGRSCAQCLEAERGIPASRTESKKSASAEGGVISAHIVVGQSSCTKCGVCARAGWRCVVAVNIDDDIRTVQYQKLPPMLVNELQKQNEIIRQQREEVQKLESRLAAIEAMLGGKATTATTEP
jgi:hypothetical protein